MNCMQIQFVMRKLFKKWFLVKSNFRKSRGCLWIQENRNFSWIIVFFRCYMTKWIIEKLKYILKKFTEINSRIISKRRVAWIFELNYIYFFLFAIFEDFIWDNNKLVIISSSRKSMSSKGNLILLLMNKWLSKKHH